MAYSNEITVGNTLFRIYENMLVPDTTNAVIGTVGIIISNGRQQGVWIAKGGGKWDRLSFIKAYGEMYITENTTTYIDETNTLNTFYITGTWNQGNVFNMSLQNSNQLTIINDVIGRFMVNAIDTLYNADAARMWNMELGIGRNNIIYGSVQGTTPTYSSYRSINNMIIAEYNALGKDWISVGNRRTNTPSAGTGINPRFIKVLARTIDTPVVALLYNSEDTCLDLNKAVIVNGSETNQWYRSTAIAYAGTKSLYISNDGGTTHAYTNTVTSVTHVYFDFDAHNLADAEWFIRFQWMCNAEAASDFLKVYLVPQSVTPVAGTEVSNAYLISPELSAISVWTEAIYNKTNLGGSSWRLIFSWKNDGSTGTNPPAAIDNIAIYCYPDYENIYLTSFEETFESGTFVTNSWTTVNGTQNNKWYVGTAEKETGSYGAYASNDLGVTANYTNTAISITHFYKDIAIPATSSAKLTYSWKCYGESGTGATSYDYGTVYIVATSVTPVAGTEQASASRVGQTGNLGKHYLQSAWQNEEVDITAYAGTTIRLVFSFSCDSSLGTNPAFCVDNIKIKYK